MQIDHLALWTDDLDRLVEFYVQYFAARPGPRYVNPAKGFESCFLSFDGGARLEIMRTTHLTPVAAPPGAQRLGLTHLAFAVGSAAEVDILTDHLRQAGFAIVDGPRRTGDGYYESVILDPDGNRLELTA